MEIILVDSGESDFLYWKNSGKNNIFYSLKGHYKK